jgi:tetratricopeptide (TPR) repeat protein
VLSPPPSNIQTSSENNSANPDVLSISSVLNKRLSTYLPSSPHGSVLVTSRTKLAASQIVDDSDVIQIDPMHQADAHALLQKKLGDELIRTSNVAELATALDNMPLALVQAAAYIRRQAPRCSVQQYLIEYAKSDSRKTSLLNQAAGHLRRDETASNAVLLTWQISFEHIRSIRRSASDLLSLMSFFDRQGIQECLLRGPSTIVNDDDFDDDVSTLRDYYFITAPDSKMFEMHSLVQLATRTWLENQGQLDRFRDQFVANLCEELPPGTYENWGKCQALFPHAKAALTQQPKDKESRKRWAILLYNAAWYSLLQRRAGEAEHMSMMSLEVMQEVCSEESRETLYSLGLLGQAKDIGGKYEEAERILKQALALSEKVLGPSHPDMLGSMNNLALVLQSQGKYEEAEGINRQTLALNVEVLGPKHPETLTSMNNLASVLRSQGKYEEAEGINRQTLALRVEVLGPKHPNTLGSMNNLALVLQSQGKYEEAEGINRQTLALNVEVLGPEHPNTLGSMNNLASVLRNQGKYEEAEGMNRQMLALKVEVLGPEHPNTLTSMNNLAYILADQRHYPEALTLTRPSHTLLYTVLGEDHPHMRQCHENYAMTISEAAEEQRVAALPPATQNSIAERVHKRKRKASRSEQLPPNTDVDSSSRPKHAMSRRRD